jgi:hypothetical protein
LKSSLVIVGTTSHQGREKQVLSWHNFSSRSREARVVLAQLVVNISTDLIGNSKGSIDGESKVQSGPNSGICTVCQEVCETVEGEEWIFGMSTGQDEGEVVPSKHPPQDHDGAVRLSGVSSGVLLIGVVKQKGSPIGITNDVGIARSSVSYDSDGSPRIEYESLVVHVVHVSIERGRGVDSQDCSSIEHILIRLDNQLLRNSSECSNRAFGISSEITRVHVRSKTTLIESSCCAVYTSNNTYFIYTCFVLVAADGGNWWRNEEPRGWQHQGVRASILLQRWILKERRSWLVSSFNTKGKCILVKSIDSSSIHQFDSFFSFSLSNSFGSFSNVGIRFEF